MNKPAIHLSAPLLLLAFAPGLWAQDTSSADELVVIDLRPPEEKDGSKLFELSGKCNKEVFRIPDVASDPLKVDVLKNALAQQMGLAADGKTLTVLNWSIYYNKQVSGGGPSLGNVGLQGYSVPGKTQEKKAGSKCSRSASAGGWYLAKEITSEYFPLVSEFTGTFGGKPINIRAVYSPEARIEGKFEGGPKDTEALVETVGKTAEALVQAIVN